MTHRLICLLLAVGLPLAGACSIDSAGPAGIGGGGGSATNTVRQITLSSSGGSLEVGESIQLTATATSAAGSTVVVQFNWTSTDDDVATVSPSGLVNAVGEGHATIEAEAQGIAASYEAEVLGLFVQTAILVGAGGKTNLPTFVTWITKTLLWFEFIAQSNALSEGSRGEGRRGGDGGAQPVAGSSTAPNLTATEAFFAGGYGPDGAGAGDQAYHLDWVTETGTPLTMSVPRNGHTLSALLDGRFLITGGIDASFVPENWSSAEVFDPETMEITATGSMSVTRSDHAAALLSDGRVLVTGGSNGTNDPGRQTTEIYNPATGEFSPGADMLQPRRLHSATTLPDGRVLVVGGQGNQTAEIYDPGTNEFEALSGPVAAHGKWHTATLLLDGRVLLAGGDGDPDGFGEPTASAEVFDPSSMTFTAVGDMGTVRMKHFAQLSPDGTVLIGGGTDESGFPTAKAEVFDPETDTFTPVDDMPKVGQGQAAVLVTRPTTRP